MTYEASIFSTLSPLFAGRVYPVIFPQPPAVPVWPSARYTFVTYDREPDICGDANDGEATTTVQIDIVSSQDDGYSAHRALRIAVINSMLAFPVPVRIESEGELPDSVTRTYRTRIDYSLHGSSA